MKKILVLILVILLIVSVCSACDEKSNSTIKYDLVVIMQEGGGGYPAGKTLDGEYLAGEEINLGIPRIHPGYKFIGWESSAGKINNEESMSDAVLIMPKEDVTVTFLTEKVD